MSLGGCEVLGEAVDAEVVADEGSAVAMAGVGVGGTTTGVPGCPSLIGVFVLGFTLALGPIGLVLGVLEEL